jgi:Transcriptional regulator/sugar kinase
MCKSYCIGIDIGGTFIRVGALDSSANVLDHFVISSDILQTGENPLIKLEDLIKRIEKKGFGKLSGIGLGIPGTINKSKGIITSVPNVRSLENLKIVEHIKNAFQVPVVIDNDVSLLLLYEIKKRKLEQSQCIIGCFAGTGLGNAIYMNGRIWEGAHGAAAELGHIPVLGSNADCFCGKKGCIELYSSGKRLLEIHAEHFSDVSYGDLFLKYAGSEEIAAFIDNIAVAVATEVVLLDPEYIILGGGVVNMKGFPFDLLKSCIHRHTFRINQDQAANILFADDNKLAGITGAVYRLLETSN